jgi:hypothetical protein
MARVLDVLRQFFGRDTPIIPVGDNLLHGGINPASRNELFYAELIEDKWDEKYRDYPWPSGWQS